MHRYVGLQLIQAHITYCVGFKAQRCYLSSFTAFCEELLVEVCDLFWGSLALHITVEIRNIKYFCVA